MTPSELIHQAKCPELPSEILMQYATSFIEQEMIQVAYSTKSPQEFRQDLLGAKRFIDSCCGITLRTAFANEVFFFDDLSDADILLGCIKAIEKKLTNDEKV